MLLPNDWLLNGIPSAVPFEHTSDKTQFPPGG
jgi:hypothetical protein